MMNVFKKTLDYILNNWWLRHLLFWLFMINYNVFAFRYDITEGSFTSMFEGKRIYVSALQAYEDQLAFIPGFMLLVYSTLYILVPRLLLRKKIFLFFIALVGFIFLAIVFTKSLGLSPRIGAFAPSGFSWTNGANVLPFVNITAVALCLKMIKFSYFQERKTLLAQKAKNQTELDILKSQIHPQFLFNTMNNLFSHTVQDSPDSPKIVLKLSDLLRFMIYESKDEFISLTTEIQVLKNYLELEKLRIGTDLDVSFTYSGNIENKLISPLLLLPLVEYSLKQITEQHTEQKWISIDMGVENDLLRFKLANSREVGKSLDSSVLTKDPGVENVRRRLELQYSGHHNLVLSSDEGMGQVRLDIQVKDATGNNYLNRNGSRPEFTISESGS